MKTAATIKALEEVQHHCYQARSHESYEMALKHLDNAATLASAVKSDAVRRQARKMIDDATTLVHTHHLPTLVDQLGACAAQAAELDKQATRIKEKLIASGRDVVEGKLFRATVTHGERSCLNMDAVRAKLSPQFIAANTTTKPYVTVRVVARNNQGLSEDGKT